MGAQGSSSSERVVAQRRKTGRSAVVYFPNTPSAGVCKHTAMKLASEADESNNHSSVTNKALPTSAQTPSSTTTLLTHSPQPLPYTLHTTTPTPHPHLVEVLANDPVS